MTRISATIVAVPPAPILPAVLHRLSWVDEVVVGVPISEPYTLDLSGSGARVVVLTPSPVVELSRAEVEAHVSHDWICHVDDDEVLSPEAGRIFHRALIDFPDAAAFVVQVRHHCLGQNTGFGAAKTVLYRRGSLEWNEEVHSTPVVYGPVYELPSAAVWVDNLSSPTVAEFLAKVNRFTTEIVNHATEVPIGNLGLIEEALGYLDEKIRLVQPTSKYREAFCLMMFLETLVQQLKVWEMSQPPGPESYAAFVDRVLAEPTSW